MEKMVKQVENDVKEINKNIKNALKQISFIDEVLRKKGLAQLQRNFGLIMILKRDVKITDNEQEAEDDDYYLYEWDPDIDKKIYRIPKFREKIEKELKKCEEILYGLKIPLGHLKQPLEQTVSVLCSEHDVEQVFPHKILQFTLEI